MKVRLVRINAPEVGGDDCATGIAVRDRLRGEDPGKGDPTPDPVGRVGEV